ncbi:hypothetical protein C8J56DRAFT_7289 [Mycena floridula]|nr:hypothetical protein C8J56DRAFT_7289 [Mycena floridula]
MPAPASEKTQQTPVIGHVNLMVDTFIANANVDDLRAISRGLLASALPGVADAFTSVARNRLRHTSVKSCVIHHPLFTKNAPTSNLYDALAKARTIYGVGMGFASLGILTEVVHVTIGLQWGQDGEIIKALADIDTDITQAIQSCKEEIESGRIEDYAAARDTVNCLHVVVEKSRADVETWKGEFPFERTRSSLVYWKL